MLIKLIWLFFVYSFAGWILETITAAIRQKKFVNRGIINGPFCIIYGAAGCIITIFISELQGIWLFLGSVILTSLVEWIGGHLIERLYHEKWWHYDKLRWNLDGYISLPTSIIWGVLGVFVIKMGNPFLLRLFDAVPSIVMMAVVVGLLVLLGIDAAATLMILSGHSKKSDKWHEADAYMESISRRLTKTINRIVSSRLNKAYPLKRPIEIEIADDTVFASGCGFYKIVLLFFIGAFFGDLIETVFCRVTAGVWMSRTSVVWGDFSIVWGLAIAIATALLYKYRHYSDSSLFLIGTFLGGTYEYVCSVFTEIVFGTVFWSYSHMPFNLGGRINLLFCFFWGIATVVWIKKLYPVISGVIEKIPKMIGKYLTWLLLIFMTINIVISCAALVRYSARNENSKAQTAFGKWIDSRFADERMEEIYPNAIIVHDKGE